MKSRYKAREVCIPPFANKYQPSMQQLGREPLPEEPPDGFDEVRIARAVAKRKRKYEDNKS